MTQEETDRELLIKEISTRLPYGVKAKVLGWDEEKGEIEVPLRVYSINTDGYIYFESNDYDIDYVAVDDCLLYLRPISSMTDEERVYWMKLLNNLKRGGNIDLILDFYNSHHFDYHGLIEKGLALDCTGLNIY